MMRKISVIGSGTMGIGIAQTFLMNNFKVNLIDISKKSLEQSFKRMELSLEKMLVKKNITKKIYDNSLRNISLSTDLESSLNGIELVVEAIPENFNLKCKLFKEIDSICDSDVIFASNTSSISITKLAAFTSRPDKFIGMHFMNPVPLMKLVEIIKGFHTSKKVVDFIFSLSKGIHKFPVLVNDYPGFISNRILLPMINEAIYALYEKVAGVEEIDKVMILGMSHPMGPLHLADFIGLDTCLSILEVLYQGFNNQKYAPCPLLVNMVNAGNLGVKTGEGFYLYGKNYNDKFVSNQFK
ncbi:MAG: 3-hydroxybutyryl-CoA dehydrogenase [Flavobacteriales bacterium TMED288]|nr:3-hydroxybutyryl-CoA dehydrogenase [Flavobacteriales bacterium]RPG53677.1 MAG: 3-hydroxybutyryl-CoA dehydrogenase [Flavobacteriales bacterium TMED288]